MKITDKTADIAPTTVTIGSVQWEYRTMNIKPDLPLDPFGAEGWELVAVVPFFHNPSVVTAYFKRRLG